LAALFAFVKNDFDYFVAVTTACAVSGLLKIVVANKRPVNTASAHIVTLQHDLFVELPILPQIYM